MPEAWNLAVCVRTLRISANDAVPELVRGILGFCAP